MSGVVEVPRVRENNGRVSSSPGLSSPPTPSSPTHPKPTTQAPLLLKPHLHPPDGHHEANHGGEKVEETSDAKNILAPAKKPRKKRDPTNTAAKRQADAKNGTSSATLNGDEPVVKPRKPRSDKGIPKKGRRSNVLPATSHTDVATGQSKIADTLALSQPPSIPHTPATFQISQNGKDEAIPTPPDPRYIPQYIARSPTPRNSGQNYDPIRSSTVEARSIPPTPSNQHLRSPTPPRPAAYGSASNSPSISSLIDPPSHISYPQLKRDSDIHAASSPLKKARLTPPEAVTIQQVPEATHRSSLPSNALSTTKDIPLPMELDDAAQVTAKAPSRGRKSSNSTGASTPAATKARQKEAPVASGNGLLSASSLFGGPSESSGPEKIAPTVVLDIPLNGENNKYINFARLAEERYGFNALHPRLAAQRERLARVAAAGAALENAEKRANGSAMSADDMSVDLSEGEAGGEDSNVEMGGIGAIERDVLGAGRSPGDGSEGPAPVKRKKRMMKEDQYDKDDPFVDDTELAWEEQAAASKDGFFVYSGPLVPEGEKPNVERYVLPRNQSLLLTSTYNVKSRMTFMA